MAATLGTCLAAFAEDIRVTGTVTDRAGVPVIGAVVQIPGGTSGTMTDEVFGTVMAHAASYILPYSDSTDYGDNAELLGAYLTLSIDSTYYLESSQEGIHQRIKIYELTSPIDSTLIFCNST